MSHDDLAMIQRWREHRDAEAFHALVLRHAGMVYGTCRRILKNSAEAEDAAQDCFEQLARATKAPERHVGAWLHRLATNLCLNRLRSEHRRNDRERRFWGIAEPVVDPAWDDLYAYVDEAMAELPDALRIPVTQHFLEGQTHEVIAAALGTSRRNVGYRIDKGIEQIRKSLRKRGIQMAGGALAAMLATNVCEATPASLIATLGKLAVAGPSAGAVSASVGVLSIASLLTVKNMLVAVIGVVIIGGGVWAGLNATSRPKSAAPLAPAPLLAPQLNSVETASSAAPVQAPATQSGTPNALSAGVTTGSPGSFGMVFSGIVANMPSQSAAPSGQPGADEGCIVCGMFPIAVGTSGFEYALSPDGAFSIAIPPEQARVLTVDSRGYAYARCATTGEASDVTPIVMRADGVRDIALTLEPGGSISGTYADIKGRVIPNGRINSQMIVTDDFSLYVREVLTDSKGAFRIRALPAGNYELASHGIGAVAKVRVAVAKGQDLQDLTLQEPNEVTLIEGRVTDRTGAPLENTTVLLECNAPDVPASTWTGADGRYTLRASREGTYRVTAADPDYCPVSRMVETGAGPVDFTLGDPPGSIEGVVTRAGDGQPIKDFMIDSMIDKTIKGADPQSESATGSETSSQAFTDADGRFTMKIYKAGEISLTARALGYATAHVGLSHFAPPQKLSGIMIQLTPAEGLKGMVADYQGHGVAGARILSQHWPLDPAFLDQNTLTTSDDGGFFTIDASKAGISELTAYHADFPPKTVSLAQNVGDKGLLRIEFPRGATVEGKVTCGGQPAAGQTVHALATFIAVDKQTTFLNKTTITSDDGSYRFAGLPEGNVDVSLAYRTDPAQTSAPASSLGQHTQTQDGAGSVVDFELPKHNAALAGRIRVGGAPPLQATASLRLDSVGDPNGGESCGAEVKPDGTFSTQGVPSGTGMLEVTLAGPSARTRFVPVRLDPNRTTTCDVDFVPTDAAVDVSVLAPEVTLQDASFSLTVETALGTDVISVPVHALSDTYRFEGVPAGSAKLVAEFRIGGVWATRRTVLFDAKAGESAQADIVLGSGHIAAHVTIPVGREALVLVFSGDDGDELIHTPLDGLMHRPDLCTTAHPGPDGAALLEGFGPGTYTVVAVVLDRTTFPQERSLETYAPTLTVVHVLDGQDAEATLTLP